MSHPKLQREGTAFTHLSSATQQLQAVIINDAMQCSCKLQVFHCTPLAMLSLQIRQ